MTDRLPINRITMNITAYSCVVCGKWHRKGSRPFEAHFDANRKAHGWPAPFAASDAAAPQPPTPRP